MRALLLALLLPLVGQAADKLCVVNYDWFTAKGFTYHGVTITQIGETDGSEDKDKVTNPFFKPGKIVVKIQGGSAPGTKEIDRGTWVSAIGACQRTDVPDSIKNLFGIPKAELALGSAVLAPVDFGFADLDGDGISDGVTLPARATGIAVELGLGDGGFGERVDYPTGPDPTKLDLADLNGDQELDVIVVNTGDFGQNNGGIAVLLGNGDGTFQSATPYAVGGQVWSLFVDDFNADQHIDVALGRSDPNGLEGSLEVLYGDGSGGLGAPVVYPVGVDPFSIVCADFNGDGFADLAVANRQSGTISVFSGNASGSLDDPRHVPVGGRPEYLGAAHLDADGRADLVILHSLTATLSAWRGRADGSLSFSGRYLAGTGAGSFEILESNDDLPAVLAPDSTGLRFHYFLVDRENGRLVGPPAYLVGEGARDVALGDFNGDQTVDLAVASGGGGVETLLGLGDGDFDEPTAVPVDPALANGFRTALDTGSFGSDDLLDLAVVHNARDQTTILNGLGDGTFTVGASLAGVDNPTDVAAVDLNGDERDDLIVAQEQRQGPVSLAVYLQDAQGAFQGPVLYPHAQMVDSTNIAVGDLNSDARPDVVVANSDLTGPNGGVSILLTNPDGTLGAATRLEPGADVRSVAVAEFNGDGQSDIVYAGKAAGGGFRFVAGVLLGNGDGTFQDANLIDIDSSPDTVISDDFNQDGAADIVVAHCCGGTDLTQMWGNGDGTFRINDYPGGQDPVGLASADFDQDGLPDLAVVDSATGRTNGIVSILLTPEPPLLNFSAATNRFRLIPPESIVAAYGTGLAVTTATASSADWPEDLAGTRVSIRDVNGVTHAGRVYYASPNQVNYYAPPGVVPGLALVTITAGDGTVNQSLVRVGVVGPGIFTAGPDVAAAFVLRISSDGTRQTESTVFAGTTGGHFARGIELGADDEDVLLLLFGTGVRGRTSLADVTVNIGGVEAEVLYAGPQGEFLGLDQINIRIPRELRGRGVVDVVVTVNDLVSNPAQIRIR